MIVCYDFVIFDKCTDKIVKFMVGKKKAEKSVKQAILLIGADMEGGRRGDPPKGKG